MDETAPTVVVVGASAGGVEALTALAGGLPEDLGATACVFLHHSPEAESRLAEIMSRAGPLLASRVRGAEQLERRRAELPIHTVVRDRPDRILPLAELAPAVAAEVRRLSDEPDVSENRAGEMNPELAYADGTVERRRESVEAAPWTAIGALQERGGADGRDG